MRWPTNSRSRLTRIFLRDEQRPRAGVTAHHAAHADAIRISAITCCSTNTSTATRGRGVGASHQTGWTGLVAKLLLPRYQRAVVEPREAPQPAHDGTPAEPRPAPGTPRRRAARTGDHR